MRSLSLHRRRAVLALRWTGLALVAVALLGADAERDDVLNAALGQLVFGIADDSSGLASALRGHSLARSIYGYDDQTLNTVPFNGTGRLHFVHPLGDGPFAGLDDSRLVNYLPLANEPIRDPERYGSRGGPGDPRPLFTGGFNASYTYPDENNMFLAAVRADGTLISPSFHRESLFGPLDPRNPNWYSPQGRYFGLRPRPVDMGPGFPFPIAGGDVKNLPEAPGGNDSIWMDLGHPVATAADGTRYKPLFAYLVLDLDNALDVLGLSGTRRRRLVTAIPSAIERPSVAPWIFDRAHDSHYGLAPGAPDSAPGGPPVPFPPFAFRSRPVPPFSDFRTPGRAADDPETDWRGQRALALVAEALAGDAQISSPWLRRLDAAMQGRVDLARTLAPYTPHHPNRVVGMVRARRDRETFAEEIYRNLLLVTGAPPLDRSSEDALDTRRRLAQLAVNIVDFIDEDEVSTAFNFVSPALDGLPAEMSGDGAHTAAGELLPKYWVFGTELPRVVLNEVMAEFEEPDPADPDRDRVGVRVWAELWNPDLAVPDVASARPDPLRPGDRRPVRLFAPRGLGPSDGYSIYELVIARRAPGAASPLHGDPGNGVGAAGELLSRVRFPPRVWTVRWPFAAGPASLRDDAYLIVGPASRGGQDRAGSIGDGAEPGTGWHRSPGMEVDADVDPATAGVAILLRRLANPHLPPDANPTNGGGANPRYNPYVTIDYVDAVQPASPGATTQAIGKRQPFAAHPARLSPQTAVRRAAALHTLGSANRPSEPFDHLVHLDRELTSPLELLMVSGVRPHELLQQFITTPPGRPPDFAHLAPWTDADLAAGPSHRLHRLFEFVQSGPRPDDETNLNAVHDLAAFLAALRPPPGLRAEAERIWDDLVRLRSPGLPQGALSDSDRPFRPLGLPIRPPGDPQAGPRGLGLNDTLLRGLSHDASGADPRLFELASVADPYDRQTLLRLAHERLTTRSNVFAVWVTVGFFEVVDDTAVPEKLGPEVGVRTGTQTRYPFFAIVDRTQLALLGDTGSGHLTHAAERVRRPGPHWLRLDALAGATTTPERDDTGAATGRLLPWRIAPGTWLLFGDGRQRELVLVTDVRPGANAILASFTRRHPPGAGVTIPGNPGPQPDFDFRDPRYRDIVPFATELD